MAKKPNVHASINARSNDLNNIFGQGSKAGKAVSVKDDSEQAIINFLDYTLQISNIVSLKRRFESIDEYYSLEDNKGKSERLIKALNRLGDKSKIQDMKVPLVATQVETATNYLQETFLSGYPIFGVTGTKNYADEASMIESQFAENETTANWAGNLSKCYRDGLKYNMMHAKVVWERRLVPQIQNNVNNANGAKAQDVFWEGNVIKWLSPYNTVIDRRVPPNEAHIRGEFAYHNELITRIELKQMIIDMQRKGVPLRNTKAALESQANDNVSTQYVTPSINPDVFDQANGNGQVNWSSWLRNSTNSTNDISYASSYVRTYLYARIIPSEFGLAATAQHTPQIWEFCIINGRHVLFARPMDNMHDMLPIITGQPHDDGLAYQSKSLADNARPFQDMASALWNIHINAQRRNMTDRVIYDPSLVDAAQINNPNPSAKIPLKANAMGTPIDRAVYAFPFRDTTTGMPQEAQAIVGFANQMNGQNQAAQGQFVKGNKTQFEYNDVMQNSSFRNRQFALTIEKSFHQGIKTVLLYNVLQYQTPQDLVRVAGDAAYVNGQEQDTITFNPVKVRDANLAFKVCDGNLPKAKVIGTDQWNAALNALGTTPQIGQEYSMGDIFSYLMSQQQVNLTPFKKPKQQVMYEQALQSWQQTAVEIAKSGKTPPPQPKPADYGLNPDGSVMTQPSPTNNQLAGAAMVNTNQGIPGMAPDNSPTNSPEQGQQVAPPSGAQ